MADRGNSDSRGARLAKEHKDSPRRIDAAVAAVMAVPRAAELAGASRPDIYIRARCDPGCPARGRSMGHALLEPGPWVDGRSRAHRPRKERHSVAGVTCQ